jgi:hypothetical protein
MSFFRAEKLPVKHTNFSGIHPQHIEIHV